jgi:hypothetical protein
VPLSLPGAFVRHHASTAWRNRLSSPFPGWTGTSRKSKAPFSWLALLAGLRRKHNARLDERVG